MAKIKVQGGDIFYEISGQGHIPLVLIPGMGRSSRYWLGLEALTREPNFKVLKWDPRGTGNSNAPTPLNLAVDDIAGDLLSILDTAGFESAHVVGLSLGGMVGIATALRESSRVRSLQLINSSVGGFRIPRITPGAFKAMTAARISKEHLDEVLIDMLAGNQLTPGIRQEVLNQWRQVDEDRLRLSKTVSLQLLAAARFNVARKISQLELPINLLVGTADRWVPPANSYLLHQAIKVSRLSVFPGGGHELMIDRPKEVCEVLTGFIQEVEDRTEVLGH